MNKTEIIDSLALISKYPENIDWRYDPCNVSPREWNEEVDCRAAVLKAMPKHSNMHLRLSKRVADILGNQWITYPWLCRALGKIIATTESYNDLETITNLEG